MTIALCMIVKDEAPVIERCLASVRPLIDTWVICDTGSTDGTAELIERSLDGIPGSLHHRPWVSFGHNRSELMERALGRADHLLLLDADWTLELDGPLPQLREDCYLIRFQGDLDFALPALVRGDIAWRYHGAAHEYLTAEVPFGRARLEGASFVNHSDGNDSSRRIERNRALLEGDLERSPDDPRTIFYLGLSYQDLGEADRAIELLLRRADMGGWEEEVFYATYRAGVLTAARDWEAGVPLLLRAWQLRPTRAEPLHELAQGYRRRGEHHLAELFARRAVALPVPDDLLFVHRPPYEWGAQFELAIATWWTGNHDESLALDEALLDGRPLPLEIEQHVRQNRQVELDRRAGRTIGRPEGAAAAVPVLLSDLVGSTRVHQLVLGDPGSALLEVGLAADQGGYRALAAFGDEAALFQLDDDFSVLATTPIAPARWRRPRLVATDHGWVALVDVGPSPEEATWPALLLLDGRAPVALPAPRPGPDERGWVPLVGDARLEVLRSLDPLVVLAVAPEGTATVVTDELGQAEARAWTGAGSAVAGEAGALIVVCDRASGGHRFVSLDRDRRPVARSAPFTALEPTEQVIDLCQRGPSLVLSISTSDREAFFLRMGADEVQAQCTPW